MTGWPSSGLVADSSLAGVVGAIATARHTGVLRLEQDGRPYSMSFQGGEIVDAESSAPEDTYGRVAHDSGLIDASVVGESIRRLAREPGKTQRDILREMGAIKDEDAARLEKLALTRRAQRPFALKQASYTFEAATSVPRDPGGPLDARWLLYRGLRGSYDERRLDKELAFLNDKAFRLPTDSDTILAPFGFADDEHLVVAYLQKGYWELFDLADACMSLPRQAVLAVVLSLHVTAILDAQPSASVPRLRKRVREATVRLSRDMIPTTPGGGLPVVPPPVRPPSAPAPAVASGSGPARAVIGPAPVHSASTPVVPVTGSNSVVTSSVQSRQVRPVSAPVGSVSQSTPPVQVTQTIKDQILAKLAQVEGGVDHFTLLEISRKASAAEIKNAYFNLAKTFHPDRLALVKLEAMRSQVARIFSRLSDAYNVLSDETRRAEYMRILGLGGEAAVKKREDEQVAQATKLLTAEDHFRKGEMALRREQFVVAEKEFRSALDLNDLEAEHHALYAWAKWCAASDREAIFPEVKKGFARAQELNSNCVAAYLYFGEVYIARGEHERAYAMFQRVLGINEDHVEASRQVRLIEMRRHKTGEKRGILDLFKKR